MQIHITNLRTDKEYILRFMRIKNKYSNLKHSNLFSLESQRHQKQSNYLKFLLFKEYLLRKEDILMGLLEPLSFFF